MTERELLVWMADEFHDWIDGDDPVDEYEISGQSIIVRFEDGSAFNIQVSRFEE